jgi:beta-lactamase class A
LFVGSDCRSGASCLPSRHDKTGTGENGIANDIAVAWPPGRAPVVVSAYFAESRLAANDRNAVLAEVARIVSAGR